MRVCPNSRCKLIHDDEVGQCPGCGANMSRSPDRAAVMDPNAHLFSLRANAGIPSVQGQAGQMRQGAEPVYQDTRAIAEAAREIVLADLLS